MHFRLRNDIGCCQCGDAVILLDLEADRYFQLAGATAAAVIASDGHVLPSDLPDVGRLLARGLLVAADEAPAETSSLTIALPLCDVLADAPVHAPLVEAARAAWLQLRATRALRRHRLADILAAMGMRHRPPAPAPAADFSKARATAAAFARSALLVGSADRCLARSLALVAMGHRAGIRPTLVFGVTADPFAAHCWVQLDDAVLTGDLDSVRQFTPILALS
jgi:hypothetical protein